MTVIVTPLKATCTFKGKKVNVVRKLEYYRGKRVTIEALLTDSNQYIYPSHFRYNLASATLKELFTIIYGSHMSDMITKDNPFLNKIKKDAEFSGGSIPVPIIYGETR